MRDLWYEICETRYSSADIESFRKLDELYEMTKTFRDDQSQFQEILMEIKATLHGTLSSTANAIDNLDNLNDVKKASGYITSGTMLGENVYTNVKCTNCGTYVGLLVGTNKCPNCGRPINR